MEYLFPNPSPYEIIDYSFLNISFNVVYSMDENIWEKLFNTHGKSQEAMWILNRYFVDFWISRGAIFLLLTNPNYFYIPPVDMNVESSLGKSYRKELKYIYSRGYRWICNLSSSDLINSLVYANRVLN